MDRAASALRSQEEALRVAKEFVRRAWELCRELGLELVAAYLVGSRARGDYRVDSDIDIVLIVRGVEGLDQLQRVEIFSRLLLEVPGPIEYRVYTPGEWSNNTSLWIRELRREAKRIDLDPSRAERD